MTTEPSGRPSGRPLRRADDLAVSFADRITAAALARAGWTSPADGAARIDEVVAMAEEWAAGRLPLAEVGRLCSPVERHLALRCGRRPIPRALLALIDALIEATPGPDGYAYRTRHGLYTERDIAGAHGAYRREPDGRVVIAWPLVTARVGGEEARWR